MSLSSIAMIAYHKLYIRLKEAKKPFKYSLKDIIEQRKSIYKLKMDDSWVLSEITKKSADFFKSIKIEYLK